MATNGSMQMTQINQIKQNNEEGCCVMYITVIDKNLCDTLLFHGYKLLNSINSTDYKVWTFKYEPHLFSLNFEDKEVSKKCFISDTLKMTF